MEKKGTCTSTSMIMFAFFFFFFFLAAPGIWKFLGQGSNPNQSL